MVAATELSADNQLSTKNHQPPGEQGVSSIGRVAVSKTVGWGFESLTPCQPSLGAGRRAKAAAPETGVKAGGRDRCKKAPSYVSASQPAKAGEVAEWSIAAVLKTAFRASGTGVRIPPSPPAFARGETESEGASDRHCELRSASRKEFVNETTKILVWVVIAGAL